MKKLLLIFILTIVAMGGNAFAFTLKCNVDSKDYKGHAWTSKTFLKCENKRKDLSFLGSSKEVGPGIRDIFYYADGKMPKVITISCPFMKATKLQKLESGKTLKLRGVVIEANALIGARIGVSVGKAGLCFVGGVSVLELLGEVAFETLELTKL
jgi:hypothetical protein